MLSNIEVLFYGVFLTMLVSKKFLTILGPNVFVLHAKDTSRQKSRKAEIITGNKFQKEKLVISSSKT